MTGRQVYESKPRQRSWGDLNDEERQQWERGAALPPTVGALHAFQPDHEVTTRGR